MADFVHRLGPGGVHRRWADGEHRLLLKQGSMLDALLGRVKIGPVEQTLIVARMARVARSSLHLLTHVVGSGRYRLALNVSLWELAMNDRLQSMKQLLTASGVVAAGAIALHGRPAAAQDHRYSQEVQVYGGEIFGDRLTKTPISGSTPRLDDSATVGARYNFNFNEMFGMEHTAGLQVSRLQDRPLRSGWRRVCVGY
jgi:hypothetical protein